MGSKNWSFFLIIIALTLIYFFPYSVHIWDSVPNIIDPLFYSWNLDHNAFSLADPGRNMLDTNIFYPLTNTIAYSDTLWALSPFTSPLIWITHNPLFVQNVTALLTYPAAALTMFYLIYYLTKHRASAYIVAIFFAFSYPRIAQVGHLPFLGSFWIPLVILFTIKFIYEGTLRSIIMACIFFVISFATSIYLGIMVLPMIFIVVIISGLEWIREKNIKVIQIRAKALAIAIIPFAIGFAFTAYPYIRLSAEYPEYKRTLFDTLELRALPKDYLSVTPQSFVHTLGLPSAPTEHALYPTIALLVLGIWGAFSAKKTDGNIFWIGLLSVLTYIILSFGAELTLWGKSVTMPYAYLFDTVILFQAIRVPARFGLFVVINLCILAGFSLRDIMQNRKLKAVPYLFLCLFILETINIKTGSVQVAVGNKVPSVYTWLRNEPDDTVIAELPLRLFYHGSPMKDQLMKSYGQLSANDNYAAETYRIYFSTYHHKNMINGYSGFFPDNYNKMAASMESFPSDESITSLRNAGVTILILHGDEYGKNLSSVLNYLDNRDDLQQTHQFGEDFVYIFTNR